MESEPPAAAIVAISDRCACEHPGRRCFCLPCSTVCGYGLSFPNSLVLESIDGRQRIKNSNLCKRRSTCQVKETRLRPTCFLPLILVLQVHEWRNTQRVRYLCRASTVRHAKISWSREERRNITMPVLAGPPWTPCITSQYRCKSWRRITTPRSLYFGLRRAVPSARKLRTQYSWPTRIRAAEENSPTTQEVCQDTMLSDFRMRLTTS